MSEFSSASFKFLLCRVVFWSLVPVSFLTKPLIELMTELWWWLGPCNEEVVTGIYILIVTFTSKLGIYTRQEIHRTAGENYPHTAPHEIHLNTKYVLKNTNKYTYTNTHQDTQREIRRKIHRRSRGILPPYSIKPSFVKINLFKKNTR